jgi:photosystem II stability/assembly factor-like uncharacterized protein
MPDLNRLRPAVAAFSILLVSLSAAAQERTSIDPEQPGEARTIEMERSQWFYGQRAYPHKLVPSRARLKALHQLDRMLALEAGEFTPRASWKLIGPQPISTPYTDPIVAGRVSALAVDPAHSDVVYLGAAMGGLWKTTNGGSLWTPLSDGQPSIAIGSIAIDPSNADIVYAGTGEENFSGDSYYGAGILKSADGGKSWTQYCGPFCGPLGKDGYYGGGARIGGIAIDPADNQVLLAAAALSGKDGIYRSSDGGQTWARVLPGNPGTAVLFDPGDGNTAYAAIGNIFAGGVTGVYKSTDAGQSWSPDNGSGADSLPLGDAARIALAMAPQNHRTLFAGVASRSSGSLLGLFKTTDGGAHWTQLAATPDYCSPQCSYDNAIAVDPKDSNVVFAGGAFSTTLVRSLDGGTTWSVLQSAQHGGFLHADIHALTFSADGKVLYLGNDGGAYSTTQIKKSLPSYDGLNQTLAITQFYPGLSIAPSSPLTAIGGTQDNGTDIYSGQLAWEDVTCGDGGYTAIDFANPSTMYATCQQIYIEKSTAGGAFGSWHLMESGINLSDRGAFIPPLVMDPGASSNLYFGTYRIYQTRNGAGSWSAISPDLTNGNSFWGVVTAIAVAPSDGNVVYAGTGDSNLWITTNALSGGATWAKVSSHLPPRVLTALAVHPASPGTAYVVFSGFSGFGDTLGHVFKTIDSGASWKDVSGNLPNTPINAIVINPERPGQVFVGTDSGVFYTNNDKKWRPLAAGLPRVAVLGLTLHAPSSTLRAATHGRSVWDLDISGLR